MVQDRDEIYGKTFFQWRGFSKRLAVLLYTFLEVFVLTLYAVTQCQESFCH